MKTKTVKWKGFVLYPANSSQSGIKVSARVLEQTFVAVDPTTKRPIQMVTIMPSGLHLGWDQCGVCSSQFRQCKCKTGLYHTRSVAWCRGFEDRRSHTDRTHTLITDYEHLFDPFGDIARKAMQVAQSPRIGTLQPHTAPKVIKPVVSTTPTTKGRQKPSQGVLGPVDNSDSIDIDLGAVDVAASESATKAQNQMNRLLNAKPTRKVTRRKISKIK